MACCSSCAVSERARATFVADPIARKLAASASGQSMGLIAVWPSDVTDLKRRIDPSMTATDIAVQRCSKLNDGERASWAAFFKAWVAFRDSDVPWFGSAAKYDEADAYRVQLGGWQELLGDKCPIAGPRVGTEPESAAAASLIKWVAVAAIVVAGAYTVGSLVPLVKRKS